MSILTNLARSATDLFMFSLLAAVSAVLGCGVMPAGQYLSLSVVSQLCLLRWFTLKWQAFLHKLQELPPRGGAQAFVSRLVMQAVFDVLESQGRRALLPDSAVSSILNQL
ncbi:hypothetical protein KIN20_010156 [Parelaphostrongylus tenuis]|uniref:Uncharacterized protein n=1 Tax=Parelaphostrongylus tenuis TaxID=148309 RepID=A0AAD5QL79_PARTN|nr:hypothetical protein KIN20_010156 [Parelaphostrongylus tenuis]